MHNYMLIELLFCIVDLLSGLMAFTAFLIETHYSHFILMDLFSLHEQVTKAISTLA